MAVEYDGENFDMDMDTEDEELESEVVEGVSEDEDEEFLMDMDSDDDDSEGHLEAPPEGQSKIESKASSEVPSEDSLDSLDGLIVRIAGFVSSRGLKPEDLRHTLFDGILRDLAIKNGLEYEDVIMASSSEDIGYNKLFVGLFPSLGRFFNPTDEYPINRDNLISLLNQSLDILESGTVLVSQEPSDDYEVDPEVEAYTMRILNVYKDLFEVGFELKIPYGVLVKDGALRLVNGKTKTIGNGSFSNLYSLLNDLSGGIVQSQIEDGTTASDLRSISMRKGTSYYPEFQLGNLFGILKDKNVESWEELSKHIRPEIFRNIRDNLRDGKDITQIVEALTTCAVISDFNVRSSVTLRVNIGNTHFSESSFKNEYSKRKSTIFAGNGDVYHCKVLGTGVMEIIIVFSQAAYNGKPLFAYEAVESLLTRGKRPSLKSMILGQDTSGKILTTNLDTQQSSIILVGAGQRSGKGVLTLNLLGTVLSEASPLIYLDGKPDMAPVLWSVGEKYGVKPAVWDLFESNGNLLGMGAPERIITENPGIFGVLMYFKALQLMMVAASLQAKGMTFGNGHRPFFIFDEAFATQMTLSSNWHKVLETAKDKNADPVEKEWCVKVVKWVESLDSDLSAVINSQLPKSGISTVWLFQSMQPTSWNPYQVSGLGSNKMNIMKKPIESRLSLKFLGRGTADSEYALGSAKIKEDNLIQNRVLSEGGRHFAMTGSQKITSMDAVTVFKPYLVLNEAENGTKSAEELKSNVSSEVLSVIAPDGELDLRAGFEGFALMLGESAIQNLALGRSYLEHVLSTVGVMQNYNTVDEYLYDASLSSFNTLGAILKGTEDEEDVSEDSLYRSGDLISPDEESDSDEGFYTTDLDSVDDNLFDNSTDTLEAMDADDLLVDKLPKRCNDCEHCTGSNFCTLLKVSAPPVGIHQDCPLYERKEPNSASEGSEVFELQSKPINEQLHYSGVYDVPMNPSRNPFKEYGTSERPMSAFKAIQEMSKILMEEIARMVGDYRRVESFEATNSGIVINDIAFRPRLPEDFIKSLPFDIKNQVLAGNIVELFHFENIMKFRNLMVLRVDNARLAEGRVRREIGLSPRKMWSALFKRFTYLNEIYIGGERITDEETAQGYDDRGRGGFGLTEMLREKFKLPVSLVSNSRMERVWHSRPVKIAGGALGVTLGVKTLMLAAPLFGAWTLLFGALSGYGAVKSMWNKSRK